MALAKAECDRSVLKFTVLQDARKVTAHSTAPLSLSAAETLLTKFERHSNSLLDIHTRVVSQTPADMDPHETEYNEINDKIFEAITQLMDIKRSLSAYTPSTPHPAKVKLPEIQLPTFDGKYEDWPSFEDLFQATIGNNVSLSAGFKLQYLKTCVKGEAANLIKNIAITDSNYTEAWNLLSTRYNNTADIVYALGKSIYTYPNLKTESAQGLHGITNSITESVRSLKALGQPVDKWDTLLNVIIIEIDSSYIQGTDRFLRNQGKQARTFHVSAAPSTCLLRKGSHQLSQCQQLLALSGSQRMQAVKKTTACLNCLRDGHPVKDCYSQNTCRKCSRRHHTLLHSENRQGNGNQHQHFTASASTQNSSDNSQTVARTNVASAPEPAKQRMFKTAMVDIMDSSGIKRPCRVLFDDCSDAEYITDKCASALGLPRTKADLKVEGVAGVTAAHCKSKISATLFSKVSSENVSVENLFVIPRITGYIPRLPCDTKQWSHLNGLALADPTFDKPGEIDILIGTGIVSYIMRNGIMHGKPDQPVAYNSIFGWVLSGLMTTTTDVVRTFHTTCKLEELVQRFWETEKLPARKLLTPEETKAEEHFVTTHRRKEDGRYVVRLPVNDKVNLLGESRDLAMNRFYQLERRLKRNPEYHQQYIEFMREYIDLGHMELVTTAARGKKYYIPHHFVRKEDRSTTKLRVVFDASMKTTSGVSLNDALLVGATIQDELFTQLIRFRTRSVAMKADIAKMYRQFEVDDDDCDLQTIFWRETSDEPFREYRLKTVTYGTGCAPFLATRVLKQLASDGRQHYPNAAKVIEEQLYVDDFLGGGKTKEQCIELYREINDLCESAQLQIRKWCSSDCEVLSAIPETMQEATASHGFDNDSTVKALGIRWNPKGDYFHFQVERKQPKSVITKREVLSEIARTFDPIGWITPTTVIAKILFQDLWKESSEWDLPVSFDIKLRWDEYCEQLVQIGKIKIPRAIIPVKVVNYQIHGYSDSSEKALACSIYLRCVDSSGAISSHLITSKSKVAPIKTISIPRLELNAAVLLAETIESIVKCFNISFTIHARTDSMITLCWITASSRRWKTYIATRVALIQDIIPASCWSHVRSSDNPADLPSRGVLPEDLNNNSLWWHGPSWLCTDQFPDGTALNADEEEVMKEEKAVATTMISAPVTCIQLDIAFNYSFLSKVVPTVGWLLRFKMYLKDKSNCQTGPLTPEERRGALMAIIKYTQQKAFKDECKSLNNNLPVSNQSKLKQLHPFIDGEGIIRVGGRLEMANISQATKHPIILPQLHHLTTLIVRDQHYKTLHGGFSLSLSMLRRGYRILRGRDSVRNISRKCVTCTRAKAVQGQQLMGVLPSPRVTITRPFLHCGVDYAGSFSVRMRRGRGAALDKCYMAVFVCFATKAVHLELVTSLSTPDFIAAFRRFTARRGIPSHMYSDCGTNFVGADKELQKMLSECAPELQQQVSRDGTKWSFNPPSAPHQGGLWEAAVKSAKYHLKRVVGNHTLTIEQFQTLLCNVEACLNSRPLCALSSDPLDCDALTPGHFLVGGPLLAVPEGDITMTTENRLDHWQRVQQMTQHFWRRWSEEYLVTLQQRPKWNREERNVLVGDLVIIKDDNIPPTKWRLGRVIATHPGTDGLVRKATVKTSSGELTRPIVKLAILLKGDEN